MSTTYHTIGSSLALTQGSGCGRNPPKKVRQEAKRLLCSIPFKNLGFDLIEKSKII